MVEPSYNESAAREPERELPERWLDSSSGAVEFELVQGDGQSQPVGTRRGPGGDMLFEEERHAQARSSRLSGRERRVLGELARGTSTEDIASKLHVSPHTVRTHVKNIMRKLDARTRAHAVAIAITEDAIDAEEI